MALKIVGPGLYRGVAPIQEGELGQTLARHGVDLMVGHPTYHNADNIGKELRRGMQAALEVYGDDTVAFVITDGTWTFDNPDSSTLDAALSSARIFLDDVDESRRDKVVVVATPYDGYKKDRTPGKGSALKLIFDEMAHIPSVRKVILLDGDLRNDFLPWFRVFHHVEEEHRSLRGDRDFFVTARYARHFVDASLTRFVVGPLTTLMGCYVPGGISGDIVLSAGAAAHERAALWDDARRRYGTDIATTFDNIADPNTDIYEVYLGAKLHDITDEAKLSVMPGEVIGSALTRILHYEELDGRVSRLIRGDISLDRPIVWDSVRTGIHFIDPGYTDIFNVDVKRRILIERFEDHQESMEEVLSHESMAALRSAHAKLATSSEIDDAPFFFLHVTRPWWIRLLYESLGTLLKRRKIEPVKKALNYLYTAAFLEFCREKIMSLGCRTLGDVRKAQASLGVPPEDAERFYGEEVDAVVDQMAFDFFRGRRGILMGS